MTTNVSGNEVAFLNATELAALIRTRKIGCVELLDLAIDRVERLDQKLNAVVVRDFDAARRRAQSLDNLPDDSSERMAPLAGVPVTVKESFDLEGHPTTWGIPKYRHHRASRNALAVDRLLNSGAVIFGKTNVPSMLSDWQTYNPIYGVTNNPWDMSRTPGGSSGGAAAALAAGLSALEIGSDIGASIRNPAHYCGVYGHKPTWGICPPRGHALAGNVAPADISVIGPLARSADDLLLGLSSIAGPDESVETGWKLALPPPRHQRLCDYRIAVLANCPTAEVDRSVETAIMGVADFLRQEGATVSLDARPEIDTDKSHELYIKLLRAATAGRMDDAEFASVQQNAMALSADESGYAPWLFRGASMTHREWLRWNELRHRMCLAWAKFFRDWDALLCPAAATEAFAHNHSGERWERMIMVNGSPQPSTTQLFWAGYSGVCYLPSTVAPAGFGSQGLPIGVQIIGPKYGDLTTIGLARWIEKGYCGFSKPPLY